MADNDSNDQNGLGDHVATSGELQENRVLDLADDFKIGPQQAHSVIDLASSGSPGHLVVPSSSPRATPARLSYPARAVDVEQVENPDERSEQPRVPVAEMLPSDPPDLPLFCSQESEATHEPMTDELSDHHPAASEAGPAYSYALTQTNSDLNASVVGQVGQVTTNAVVKRYHCPLCDKTYSRLCRVRDHFEVCQYANGNPDNKGWNDDPSCWPQRIRANPDDLVCPLCKSKFSRASEAAAHFITCADRNGNPQNIVFQGIDTGRDTLYGEEEGEVGQFRCALCDKVSGKRSHAKTHWKGCPVRQNTPARKLRGYDNMGRLMHRPEEGEESGKEVAKKPRDQGSTNYRCKLCKVRNKKRDWAVDHFKQCLRNHGLTRDDMSHLDDTGMPISPASKASMRVSETGRKRSRRVAFEDDASGDEETTSDAAPAAKKSTTEQQVAEESWGAGAASNITGTRDPVTSESPLYQIRQQLLPNGAKHLFRRRYQTLKAANKGAADLFIKEVTSGWSNEDRVGQRMRDFAKEVLDMLPGLEEGEKFWIKERDCNIDGEEGAFAVWVEEVELKGFPEI